jgi:hypothetical protein
MAYSVEQRTQEIGIRLALGATTSDVRRMIVRHGMLLAVMAADRERGACRSGNRPPRRVTRYTFATSSWLSRPITPQDSLRRGASLSGLSAV